MGEGSCLCQEVPWVKVCQKRKHVSPFAQDALIGIWVYLRVQGRLRAPVSLMLFVFSRSLDVSLEKGPCLLPFRA